MALWTAAEKPELASTVNYYEKVINFEATIQHVVRTKYKSDLGHIMSQFPISCLHWLYVCLSVCVTQLERVDEEAIPSH